MPHKQHIYIACQPIYRLLPVETKRGNVLSLCTIHYVQTHLGGNGDMSIYLSAIVAWHLNNVITLHGHQ